MTDRSQQYPVVTLLIAVLVVAALMLIAVSVACVMMGVPPPMLLGEWNW